MFVRIRWATVRVLPQCTHTIFEPSSGIPVQCTRQTRLQAREELTNYVRRHAGQGTLSGRLTVGVHSRRNPIRDRYGIRTN
jgi:hypothetical protein